MLNEKLKSKKTFFSSFRPPRLLGRRRSRSQAQWGQDRGRHRCRRRRSGYFHFHSLILSKLLVLLILLIRYNLQCAVRFHYFILSNVFSMYSLSLESQLIGKYFWKTCKRVKFEHGSFISKLLNYAISEWSFQFDLLTITFRKFTADGSFKFKVNIFKFSSFCY